MLSGDVLFLVLFLVQSAALIGLGIPLLKGRVGPNGYYGFRTSQTLKDPIVWYAANRVSGFWMIVTGLVAASIAAGTYAAKLHFGWQVFATLAALLCGLIVMAHQSDAAARRPPDDSTKLRLQFRLIELFVVTAVVAVACAIARLPGPWVLRAGLLWAYAICVLGFVMRNINPRSRSPVDERTEGALSRSESRQSADHNLS
jgi:uncharacterized membrane protein